MTDDDYEVEDWEDDLPDDEDFERDTIAAVDPEKKLRFVERRAKRIDLGIAISGATLEPGESRTLRDIADFCGCSHQAIARIEKNAIRKVKSRLAELGYTELSQILPTRRNNDNEAV